MGMGIVFKCAYALLAGLVAAQLVAGSAALAKSYDVGAEDGSEFVPAQAINKPSPVIPPDLRQNAFRSACVARVNIDENGRASIKLVSSSGVDEIDDITIRALSRWKFKPAMLDGKPVASTRRIQVEYQVD